MIFRLFSSLTAVLFVSAAIAQDPIVYPSQGQSAQQQQQDEFECYTWGRDRTQFDPMQQPTATAPPPQQQSKRGGVGRGALRGAAMGGIIDGSDGAKKGAAAGALFGGMRRADQQRSESQAQSQWEQEQAAIYNQRRGEYNRAYAACLDARGYTVR